MTHTNIDYLNLALDAFIKERPECCVDSAMKDWNQLILSEEHREYFIGIMARTIQDSHKDDKELCFKSLLMGLTIGTVCSIGMLTAQAVSTVDSLMKHEKREIN